MKAFLKSEKSPAEVHLKAASPRDRREERVSLSSFPPFAPRDVQQKAPRRMLCDRRTLPMSEAWDATGQEAPGDAQPRDEAVLVAGGGLPNAEEPR